MEPNGIKYGILLTYPSQIVINNFFITKFPKQPIFTPTSKIQQEREKKNSTQRNYEEFLSE